MEADMNILEEKGNSYYESDESFADIIILESVDKIQIPVNITCELKSHAKYGCVEKRKNSQSSSSSLYSSNENVNCSTQKNSGIVEPVSEDDLELSIECELDISDGSKVSDESLRNPVPDIDSDIQELNENTQEEESTKCHVISDTKETKQGKSLTRKRKENGRTDKSNVSSGSGAKKPSRVRNKKHSCEICGKKFFNAKILESHVDSHGGNKRFKCEVCGKEYGWRSSYQNHMVTHSGGDTHKCSTCGKVLCNNSTLQRHIERVHLKPVKNFSCDICGRNFLYSYELKYHKENHLSKKQFICEFCGKIMSTKNDLVSHVRTHTGEKPFVCEVCGKGFTWKSLMKQHMMLHFDGNCFQCEICGKQYSAQRSLARHSRLHAEDRPYKCTMCSKTFRSPSAMASHKDYHLGVKRHRCDYCGKSFLSDSNMHKHKKRHLGVKDQVCEICKKAFITKQELQMHMRSHSRSPRSSKQREEK